MANYYTYGTIPSVDETDNNPLSNYGVEFIQPTEENEVLAPVGGEVDEGRDAAEDSEVERIAKILGVPVSQVKKYANKPIDLAGYSYSGPETLSDEQLAANQKMGALFSLIDPSAFSAMNFQVGDAAFGGGASGAPTVSASYRRNLAPETVGGEGSLYEEGALEAAKTRASDPTAGLWKQGFEQLIAENPDTTQQAIKSKAERDLGALSKVEESYDVMKPLSDLLKANRFEEAFDYAKEKGVMNEIMNSSWLKQLRQPFTQDEARAFYNAIPPDFAGSDFNFDANKGSEVYDGGYPDPGSVFTRKPDNTVKNIALTMAALMLGHMAAPALFGASGSAAGAGAGAAGTGAGAGAGAGTSGALSGLKSAYQTVAAIPTKIGSTVANALGFPINSTIAQTSFGNSLISGATTAAKGGDIGDIIKSGLLAAGVTYGLDAAANAVKGIMPDISKAVGSEVSNAAATSGVSPTSALDALQEVVVTAKKVSDVAGLAGAATGAVAPSPEKATLEKAEKPEDLEEVTVTGRRIKVPPTITPVPAPEPSPIEAAQPEPVFEPAPTVDDLQEIEVTGKRIDTPPVVVSTPSPIETPFEPAPTVDDLQEIEVTGKRIDTPPVVVPPPSPLDALEEVVVTGKRTEPYIPEPPPIIINPADILKDYKPTEVKEDLNLKSILEKFGTLENILKLLGGLGSVGSKTESVTAPQTTGGLGGALPKYTYTRQQLQPDIDYYTYGTRPEAKFFEYNQQVEKPEQPVGIVPPKDQPVFASGGLTNYAHGGESESQYVQGPGSGRDDKIPALLSDGEYVIDAETLALLGDGSTKEGARRMDQFRANIRQHKGRALSRGRISPNAKSPDKYMGGGLT